MKKDSFRLKLIINLCLISLTPLSLAVYFIFRNYPEAVESFFVKLPFNVYKYTFGLIERAVPFSLTELLLFIGIPFVMIFAVVMTVKWVKKDETKKIALLFTAVIGVSSFFGSVFISVWSLNFYRYDLSTLLSLDTSPVTKEELYKTTDGIAERLNELCVSVEYDENGFSKNGNNDFYKMEKDIRKSYKNVNSVYPAVGKYPQRAKPVLASKPLSYMFIAGIYVPFTAEPNVNINYPFFIVTQSAGHEMAHSLGFAREDEAEFLGYLACKYSDNVYYEYAGYMNAYIYAGNALAKADKTKFRLVYDKLDDRIKKELSAYNDFLKQYENQSAAVISEKINNTYLVSNGQSDGTKSYGRMTDLLVAEYRKFNE